MPQVNLTVPEGWSWKFEDNDGEYEDSAVEFFFEDFPEPILSIQIGDNYLVVNSYQYRNGNLISGKDHCNYPHTCRGLEQCVDVLLPLFTEYQT